MTGPDTRLTKLAICCLLFLLSPATLTSQSHNREAVKWYRTALKKESLNARIAALKKAIELDPKYVEALLSLGRAYQGLEQFQQAEKCLKRAYTARLTAIDNELKSQILYELASTYQYLNKMKACEDALRGAKNLTPSQALKNEISIELGKILYQRDHFEAAMNELSQCQQVKPENEVFYNQLLQAAARAVELNKIYLAAEEAQQTGHVQHARELYRKIDRAMPGFRDVQEKIDSLSSKSPVQEISKAPPANTRVTGTFKTNGFGTSVPVLNSPEQAGAADPGPEPTVAAKQTRASDTSPSLPAVDARTRTQGAAVIPPASEPLPAGPDIAERRDSQRPTRRVPAHQPAPLAKLVRRPRQPGHKVELVAPRPGPPGPPQLPGNSDPPTAIKKVSARTDRASRALLLTSLLTGALLLPLLGFILVSPVARARLFNWLGQRQRAVSIYERMLIRHPHRLWLYPALARLYDRENRQDEQAMRVYRMIQHLHGKNKYADSLTANIVNKYLSDINTVPVQIEIVDRDRSGNSS